MIKEIKNWLIYSKMEKTIKLAITAIYSENFDFDKIKNRICQGGLENQLLGFIAIRKATSVVEPLKKSDVEECVQEYYLSLSRKSAQNIFSEIIKKNRLISELRWMKISLAIIRGKAAEQRNKYSIEGTIYALQRSARGPVCSEQKEEMKIASEKVEEASRKVREVEINILKERDHLEYKKYLKSINDDESDFAEEMQELIVQENELENELAQLDQKLNQLIDGEKNKDINVMSQEDFMALGFMYYDGEEVEQNYETAAKYIRTSALMGYSKAQHNMGMLYEEGEGVSQCYAEAAEWYRKASEQGYAPSLNNLGSLYATGKGVKQDLNYALELYNRASQGGDENARDNYERLKIRLRKAK
jgi:TPR repeat protein